MCIYVDRPEFQHKNHTPLADNFERVSSDSYSVYEKDKPEYKCMCAIFAVSLDNVILKMYSNRKYSEK